MRQREGRDLSRKIYYKLNRASSQARGRIDRFASDKTIDISVIYIGFKLAYDV